MPETRSVAAVRRRVRGLVRSLARRLGPWWERLRVRSRPATDWLRRHVLSPLTTRLLPWLRRHPATRWLHGRVVGPARTRLVSWYRTRLAPRLRRGRAALRRRWEATTPAQRRTARVTSLSAVVGLVMALVAVAVTGPWDGGQRRAEQARAAEHRAPDGGGERRDGHPPATAPGAEPVLAALGGRSDGHPEAGVGQVPPPSQVGLRKALGTLLDDPALGRVRAVSVVDATTGRPLYGERAASPVVPASTIKLATASAALSALGPDHRLLTRVRATGDQVVLVGGGDTTLTENQLASLADTTAERLREAGRRPDQAVTVRYDDRLYSGPARHPIGVNDNIALVSPLTVNAGRTDDSTHGPAPRTPDPALSATETFADLLRDRGVRVKGDPARAKPADAAKAARQAPLATHRSAPLSLLVERMLTHSDNDLAESLARQVAVAAGEPGSFRGASDAVRDQLEELGVPLTGSRFRDGSGLDRDDRVTAGLLTDLLALAADPRRPELRAVLTGLPVAGFNGTLASRYTDGGARAGAGLVHAKTGTLSGVNTLAGTVVDADGRLLAFAFLTTGTTDGPAAQGVLDRLAVALAGCGCR